MGVATIVATGVANIASMAAALRRSGVDVELTDDAARVRDAARVVLPGVGSFGAGMARLTERGLVEAIVGRFAAERPLLCVCLGMQLLCAASEESPGVAGLGVLDAGVRRFGEGVRVPQFGWNRVEADPGCGLLQSGLAYFANSYRIDGAPPGWSAARAVHGGPFVAALERGPVRACQFHPELSGAWGRALLERWLRLSEGFSPC